MIWPEMEARRRLEADKWQEIVGGGAGPNCQKQRKTKNKTNKNPKKYQ